MKDQLISFETAKSAKEKGLLNPTLYFYGEDGKLYTYSSERMTFNDEETKWEAPTQSLLQKWLREKHNVIVLVDVFLGKFICKVNNIIVTNNRTGDILKYDTYEKALEIGLIEGLNHI